jgi:hypothetical protein
MLELDRRMYADGVSFWDKQDQIHQATHVHGGPAFIPWHRELVNRYEALLKEVDPTVALHYWDWRTDPHNGPDGNSRGDHPVGRALERRPEALYLESHRGRHHRQGPTRP